MNTYGNRIHTIEQVGLLPSLLGFQRQVKVGFKSDVWALGVILYQLAYGGVVPYSRVPGGRLGKMKAVMSEDLPVDLEPLEDRALLDVLRRSLDKDPGRRAGVRELLGHPFLRYSVYFLFFRHLFSLPG